MIVILTGWITCIILKSFVVVRGSRILFQLKQDRRSTAPMISAWSAPAAGYVVWIPDEPVEA